MSVKKFKFVSPGIFISEIDNSQRDRVPGDIGPVIIGRSERGPGMRPVRMESFSDFVSVFGNPIPGGRGGDVWREGNYTAPTYAAYAAQAYLKNNNPINFVRLLGDSHIDKSATGDAGWAIAPPNIWASTCGGAYGLFLMYGERVSAGPGTTWTNTASTLAAIFYVPDANQRIVLAGPLSLDQSAYTNGLNGGATSSTSVWMQPSGPGATPATSTSPIFTVVVRDEPAATVTETINFSLDSGSSTWLREAFNTNPTLTNAVATATPTPYWLGQSYDSDIAAFIAGMTAAQADPTLPAANEIAVVATILPITGDAALGGDFSYDATGASTGWFFSQFTVAPGNPTDTSRTQIKDGEETLGAENLFKLHSLHGGSWESKNLKVSLQDIAAPSNPYELYGTFTVVLRRASDTDAAPQIVERFSRVNLNPNSPDYVARRIGDKYSTWSDTERRYIEYGQFANQSKFIRVEVSADVERGIADSSYLPMGCYGPSRFKNVHSNNLSTLDAHVSNVYPLLPNSTGNIFQPHGGPGEISCGPAALGAYTTVITMPEVALRANSADATLSDPTEAYFGLSTAVAGSSRMAQDYFDLTMILPDPSAANVPSGTTAAWQYMNLFTLEDLVATTTTTTTYTSGSFTGGTSMAALGDYTSPLTAGYDRYTVPLMGGFDGLDVMERDPFRNTLLAGQTELTSYAANSIKRAIDSCADPEVVECNLMTMPGLTDATLTGHMIDTCEARADTLAIIDLENDYIPDTESLATAANRVPNVDLAISALAARGINSSYGCAYFPWVQMRDTIGGQLLWAPPSIAALGTMASSSRKTELWFAPAGFTRGGLTEGSAGVPVIGVSARLTSKERDKLYEANINPIASFPNEGIVIFGQKTLQVVPSALDRINVRRLMIYLKKEVSRMAANVLFDQNTKVTWARFASKVNPFLSSIKSRFGLLEYRLVLDETTTTPELVDRNIVYAKIYLKPARAIEFIAIDFIITDTGASFDD